MSEPTLLPYFKEAFEFMEQTLRVSTEDERVEILRVYKDALKYMLTRLYDYEGKLVDEDQVNNETAKQRLALYQKLNEQYDQITKQLLGKETEDAEEK